MNIFALHQKPELAAQFHCDKHVVKMIVEYAQLLSTAHRELDGVPTVLSFTKNGKPHKKTLYVLEGEIAYVEFIADQGCPSLLFRRCYNRTHHNHPCAVWARENRANYIWLVKLFTSLLKEYEYRYGKEHGTKQYLDFLGQPPKNIMQSNKRTPFAMAMPDAYQERDDAVESYRWFYIKDKIRFAKYTRRSAPEWLTIGAGVHPSSLEREAKFHRATAGSTPVRASRIGRISGEVHRA